jgi:hypothetical protein
MVTELRAGRAVFDFGQEQMFIPFVSASRRVLKSTKPPIQWVSEALSQGIMQPGCEDNIHHLSPKLRTPGIIPPFPLHLQGVVFN